MTAAVVTQAVPQMLSTSPAQGAFVVSPNNTQVFTIRSLWIGTGGDVSVEFELGQRVLFKNIPDGTLLPIAPKRVNFTNTTATDILGLI